MNERIREVWIKAAREDSDPDNWDTQEQFIERFAELIVRECMDIAHNVGNISEPDDWALDRCYEIEQRIQDRFGVEE
jgi:hypothetical protein